MIDTASTLSKINERWIAECTCELKHQVTQPVPGEGNPEADIMFIGEAPGRDEDAQGRPFVGAAGKLLTKMLQSVGMEREDIYITNVVKYRPPNNRDPFPEEVEACWPWLEEQITAIQPELIVLLGRHALQRFFPGERISKVHGKILKRNFNNKQQCFYAVHHPAAALYRGETHETLTNDFSKLPKAVEAIKNDTLSSDKSEQEQPRQTDESAQETGHDSEPHPDQPSLF